MSKKDYNYEIVALPIEVDESCLKTTQKIILDLFYQMSNSDYANEHNGWFFISNEDLIEKTGISKPTVIGVISFLLDNDFIERITGTRTKEGAKASEYRLKKNNIKNWVIMKTTNQGLNNDGLNKTNGLNKSNGLNKNDDVYFTHHQMKILFEMIEGMQLEIKQLRNEITELKNGQGLNKINGLNKNDKVYLTTDPETETKKKKNNISSSIDNILEKKEKSNLIEKELQQSYNNSNSNNNLNLGYIDNVVPSIVTETEKNITPIEDNYNFSDTADTANTQSNPQEENKATSQQNTIQNNKTYIPMTENTTQGKNDVVEQRNIDTNVGNQDTDNTQSNFEVFEIKGDTILDNQVEMLNLALELNITEQIPMRMQRIEQYLSPKNGKMFIHRGYENFKNRYQAMAN